ncbi:MAG: copper homeostasis protein CutC, partial [Planctomycetes bacterium]|nr:copper homeostasis protein CutC [Planctomycetota bacterium]
LSGALAARDGGAHRLELCSSLSEGGLTPSAGLLREVRRRVDLDLYVLLRPRAGDFVYDELERATILADLQFALELGADGVVAGALTPDGSIDLEAARRIREAASGVGATFHRAFDQVHDASASLEAVIDAGFDRLLSSGLAPDAATGARTLSDLRRAASGRLAIMPGGGIRAENVTAVIADSGCRELHFSARVSRPRRSIPPPRVPLSSASADIDGGWSEATVESVAQIIRAARARH